MIRRLFYAPRVIVLVATIGIAELALAIVTAYPEIDDFGAPYPPAVDRARGRRARRAGHRRAARRSWSWCRSSRSRSAGSSTARCSAARSRRRPRTPTSPRVQGINPKLVSTAVWAIAGFVATLTMILVAGQTTGRERPAHARPEHAGPRAGRRGHRAAWCRSRARCSRASPSASCKRWSTSTTSTSPASSTVCSSWPC